MNSPIASHPESIRPLLKPAEAQRVLAIGARKLWSLTACGELRCVRIGKAVRYDPADLAAFISRQKSK